MSRIVIPNFNSNITQADNLNYDQIIWEFGDDENPDWVHVSYVSEDENRGRALRAYKEKGKTKYIML